MAANAFTIQEGVTVFSSDGERLGTVAHVYRHVPETDTVQTPVAGAAGTDPETMVERIQVTGDAAGYGTDIAGESSQTTPYTGSSLPEQRPSSDSVAMATADPSREGYIQVDHGGFLGIGTSHLYIPFSAVAHVEPGDCVSLTCTKDSCTSLYHNTPAALEEDSEFISE
jgi:hypothetical protein